MEQLRKIEPVLKDLYHELLDQDPKDEAEAVFVALVRVRAALAAEEEASMRRGNASMPERGRSCRKGSSHCTSPARGGQRSGYAPRLRRRADGFLVVEAVEPLREAFGENPLSKDRRS